MFDNPLYAIFADPETTADFAPPATLARYGAVEAALTRALSAEGLVDADAADAALAAIATFAPDLDRLAADSRTDGLPVPGYMRQLKAAAGAKASAAIHCGATSQDIIDTAQALALRAVNDRFAARLDDLVRTLAALMDTWRQAPLMARTRMQAALPITAADRICAWHRPLCRQALRFGEVRAGVECVSLAGPVGTGLGWDGKGAALATRVAAELGLSDPNAPWHTARDSVALYGAWLATTCGALGKMGIDIALMAQQGIETVSLAGGGGSSAMAHKHNPVDAEILVTLARYAAAQAELLQHAMVHEQERSGMAWSLEWLALPALCQATGAALCAAERLTGSITRVGDPG